MSAWGFWCDIHYIVLNIKHKLHIASELTPLTSQRKILGKPLGLVKFRMEMDHKHNSALFMKYCS
jgi:hypothetical protein